MMREYNSNGAWIRACRRTLREAGQWVRIAFSRNSGGMLLERENGDARALALPFAASHLRRLTYNNGKRNHLWPPLPRFHAERYRSRELRSL